MKFAEEMKEAFEAFEQTNIINKRNETNLLIEEKNKITYYLLKEINDVVNCGHNVLVSFCKKFNISYKT